MLQRWVDHNEQEHRVLDDYMRNRILIDLTAQPEPVKNNIVNTIDTAKTMKTNPQIGTKFLKFCGKYQLKKVSEHASGVAEFLSAPYPQ